MVIQESAQWNWLTTVQQHYTCGHKNLTECDRSTMPRLWFILIAFKFKCIVRTHCRISFATGSGGNRRVARRIEIKVVLLVRLRWLLLERQETPVHLVGAKHRRCRVTLQEAANSGPPYQPAVHNIRQQQSWNFKRFIMTQSRVYSTNCVAEHIWSNFNLGKDGPK